MKRAIVTPLALTLFACSGPEPEYASTISEVAPAGSAAAFVSSTVPMSWAPGERINVDVVMRNTGAASPANDWPVGYLLYRQNTLWSWAQTSLGTATAASPAQQTATFRQVLTAPTAPGPSSFRAQMLAIGAESGFFGDLVDIPVTIDPAKRPEWGCSLVSHNLPASLQPGQTFRANITVRNVGTRQWTAGGFCLITRDQPYGLWGSACPLINANVPGVPMNGVDGDGGTFTFSFDIVAPINGSGPTPFRRQMYQGGSAASGSVNFFSVVNDCLNTSITVGNTPPWEATFNAAGSDIDENPTYAPGERRVVTVRYTNAGSQTWTTASTILYSLNTPINLWGPRTNYPLQANTASGQLGTFRFVVTAPTVEGAYAHRWQPFNPTPAFFGQQLNIPVTVAAGATPQYGAQFVTQTLQSPIATVRPGVFRITMRNTGFATWDPARVRLTSANTPAGLWGVGNVTLPGPVAPGNAVEFVFTVQGPATPGTYASQWRLQEFADGLGVFGETATGMVDVVAVSCGNGTVEGNERCDDGNNINGDGCSATCLIENLTFDQAVSPADRTFVNDVGARDFGKVAIGDLNGDGVPDVAMGSWESVPASGNLPGRSLAGRVFVYSGVNLFDGSTTTVGTGTPLLVVNGARTNDLLSGQVEGRVLIQDVTGDGFADLIVSAAQAACIDNTNACGRVYVIAGGPQLAAVPNGVVDLLTSPFVTARIVGPFDGDRTSVITTGDLDNDGIRDVVVGMNRATVLGRVEAGAVSVVRGGPTLTGTIAASGAPEVVCEVAGAVAGDRLGLVAAVGQVNGAGGLDLVVGTAGHDSGTGGQDAGGVWVINGPLPAAVDLGATPAEWSARFLGAGIRDALGTDVRVADVTGDTNPDLIIGVAGTRIGATRFGSVDIWPGPIAAATDIDYSGGALPSVYFLGADEGDNVGSCLAVGDMNGDRVSDVAVVGRFAGGAGNALFQAGEMYVLPGGAAGQIQVGAGARTLVPGNQAMTVFGSTAAGRMCLYNGYVALGDIDGDSRDDVCVGSPQANVAGNALVRPGRLDCYQSRW